MFCSFMHWRKFSNLCSQAWDISLSCSFWLSSLMVRFLRTENNVQFGLILDGSGRFDNDHLSHNARWHPTEPAILVFWCPANNWSLWRVAAVFRKYFRLEHRFVTIGTLLERNLSSTWIFLLRLVQMMSSPNSTSRIRRIYSFVSGMNCGIHTKRWFGHRHKKVTYSNI